jgi:hypothetical protein
LPHTAKPTYASFYTHQPVLDGWKSNEIEATVVEIYVSNFQWPGIARTSFGVIISVIKTLIFLRFPGNTLQVMGFEGQRYYRITGRVDDAVNVSWVII